MNSTNNNTAAEKLKHQDTRILLSFAILTAMAIGIVLGANYYTTDTLNLDPVIEKALMRYRLGGMAVMGPLLVFLFFRWIKPLREIEKKLTINADISAEEALHGLKIGLKFPYKFSLATFSGYYAGAITVSLLLYYLQDLEFWKSAAIIGIGFPIGLSLGLSVFFGVKILLREAIDKMIQVIFSKNIFELTGFRTSLTLKIFVVFITIVSFLLVSSFLMTLSRMMDEQVQDRVNVLQTVLNMKKNSNNPGTGAWHMGSFVLDSSGKATVNNGVSLPEAEIKELIKSKSDGSRYFRTNGIVAVYNYDSLADKYTVETARVDGFDSVLGKIRNVMAVIMVMTLALCVVATFFVVSDIRRPIRTSVDYLKAISSGLNSPILPSNSDDELGVMTAEIAHTTTLLRERTIKNDVIVEAVRSAVLRLEAAMSEVVSASGEQAIGVAQQVSAAEEAISVSTEMQSSSRTIASDASEVEKAAADNANESATGRETLSKSRQSLDDITQYINEVTETVSDAEENFSRVTGIVSIIEEIAGQMELLALNAQLEAATSGIAGRRFSVVATEMARLSNITLDSVKNTRLFVKSASDSLLSIIRKVSRGNDLVTETTSMSEIISSTLDKINLAAGNTAALAQDIAHTTQQQSSASERMSLTIRDVYDSSLLIKENTDRVIASMKDLEHLAMELNKVLGQR